MRHLLLLGFIALLAANCSKPTIKDLDGKIKGKASLRLADGSTISRDDSEEYSPYMLKMDDGYLVLIFGSNRTDCGNCSGHNIFFARSLTTFDGVDLPFFNAPAALNVSGTPFNAAGQINFAVKKNGAGVRVFVNLATASDFIRYADVNDVSSPTISGWTTIINTNHESNKIIGIAADGNMLYSTDSSGVGYAFNPMSSASASPFGAGMDNATSAAPVRQENSGYENSIFGISYGTTYAAAGAQYLGPIFDLNTSLAFSGLAISKISTFVTDSAANDLVLFSAIDIFSGGTEDLYVITSHTSKGLWEIAGFFGFDFTAPSAPLADHWYDMSAPATSCPDLGIGTTLWTATCTNIGDAVAGSYNGTGAGEFSGAGYMTITGQDVGHFFSISAWVNITTVSNCSTSCVIVANSALGASADGFRLYVDGSGAVVLESGNGTASTSISTNTGLILDATWHNVIISVDRISGYAAVFVDGYEEGTTNTIRTDFATAATLSFGAPVGGAYPLTGLMDEIKIFSYSLDATTAQMVFFE